MRATAALFTLVALLAAAPAAASVERDSFVLPVDTLLPCGVGGETIHLTGTASYRVLSVADPAGGFRLLTVRRSSCREPASPRAMRTDAWAASRT